MRNISDLIEQHLKHILQNSPDGVVEIQRNELADKFRCVPSQINYVISTRFTVERGYLVESKRGGGGYVRIQRVSWPAEDRLVEHLFRAAGDRLDQSTAEALIARLEELKRTTPREASLLRAALCRDAIGLPLPLRDEVRARLFKAMVAALFGERRNST